MTHFFVFTAEVENGNSALLTHIEEVRRCQLLVCETAQEVQTEVTRLMASRAKLENHRTMLHQKLSAITNILSSKNQHSSFDGLKLLPELSSNKKNTKAGTSH